MTPRTRRNRRALWLALALPWLIVLAAVWTTSRANADPIDDYAYISTLDYYGVDYSTRAAVIDAGHAVCSGLDRGLTPIGVVRIAVQAGWNQSDAAHMVGAAIGSYCDEFSYLISRDSSVALSGHYGGQI
jgi:hypothetical protein